MLKFFGRKCFSSITMKTHLRQYPVRQGNTGERLSWREEFGEKRSLTDKAALYVLKSIENYEQVTPIVPLVVERLFLLLQDFKKNHYALQKMCTPSLFKEFKFHHDFFDQENAALKLSVNVQDSIRIGIVNVGWSDLGHSRDFLDSTDYYYYPRIGQGCISFPKESGFPIQANITVSQEILMNAVISVDFTAKNHDGNTVKLLDNETRELSLRLDMTNFTEDDISLQWRVSDIDNAIFQKNFEKL